MDLQGFAVCLQKILSFFAETFLGYPIWWDKAPKIIFTFLESHNLVGKIVVPFCTSHSSGIGSSDTDLQRLVARTEHCLAVEFLPESAQSENLHHRTVRFVEMVELAG